MSDLKSILKHHGLKNTANRQLILQAFVNEKHALAYSDVDALIKQQLDKVTVYRTLKSFEESGIIHQVLDGSAQIRYALCHTGGCSHHEHTDQHPHFKCDTCEKTFCLDTVTIPKINLPSGYSKTTQSVFIQGICKSCSAQH